MSPHVGNFVQDLVEMAKAMEELPKVQGELSDTRKELSAALNRVEDRELRIIDLKSQIESLQSTLRTTEASRDDAELRFLELEETSDMVRRVLNEISNSARNQAAQITHVIDPPKPEPEPEVQQPNLDPIGSSSGGQSPGQSSGHQEGGQQEPTGQSESNPTGMPPVGSQESNHIASESHQDLLKTVTTAQEQDGAGANPLPSGPYHNKRYIDIPGFVSREVWLAGGGTAENYDWRGR